MKKLFTIIAAVAFTTFAFGQTHNLSVAFDNYKDGDVTSNPFKFSYTITNSGSTTILAGDSIVQWFLYDLDFKIVDGGALVGGSVNTLTLNADFAPGDVLQVESGVVFNLPANVSGAQGMESICLVAYHEGPKFDLSDPNTWIDADDSDNMSCVDVTVATSLQQSLVDLSKQMYVADDQLIIHGSNYSFGEAAKVKVFDASGRDIINASIELNGESYISLSGCDTGIYFVRLIVGGEIITKKLFKK